MQAFILLEPSSSIHGWVIVFSGQSKEKASAQHNKQKEPEDQKIYISIRPNFVHRYLINQVDFLCSLISAFSRKYPDMEFVLDGFSLPEDVERPVYSDFFRSLFSEMLEKSGAAIEKILYALPDAEIKIHNITGLNLSNALEIISSCSYYVVPV